MTERQRGIEKKQREIDEVCMRVCEREKETKVHIEKEDRQREKDLERKINRQRKIEKDKYRKKRERGW